MATILRSYKYINFFTGYHLKTYQSNYSPLQHVLKSHYAALHSNRSSASVAVSEFLQEKPLPAPKNILEGIRERYITSKSSTHKELVMFLKCVHNNSSLIQPASTSLVLQKDIQILIQCCGKAMKSEMPNVRAQIINNLWQMFKTMGLHLNLSHYNALLQVYLENEQDFSPAEILLEMSNNNIQPDELTYEYLLTHYCRKGNIEEANKILNYLKESEIPVNENIFNALIIGNAEANDMNGALNILGIMKVMGCIPSSKTYAALLEANAKKGDINSIMNTLKNCESKDIIILDQYKMDIVYYLAINGHAEHIDKILSTFSWDTSFVNENKNFISKLMYHKQVDVAIQLLLAAKKAGVPESQLNAIAQPFGKNIVALDLPEEKIVETFNLLEKEGFFMYENALQHCLNEKIARYCIPLFRAWRKTGCEIKEHFFWPIFAMHGAQNVEGVLETLQFMKKEFNIMPSFDTLTRFILPYIKSSSSSDTMKMLIGDFGIPAESIVNAILYNELSRNKIESAVKCIKESARYDITYDKKILSPLLNNALKFTNNTASYNIIKSQFQEKQDFKEKRKNSKFYLLPTLHTINLGFELQHCSEKGDLIGAEKCIRELMRFHHCKLTLDKLLNYFDLLVKHDKLKDSLQLLRDFLSEEKCVIRYNKKTLEKCLSSLNLLADKGAVEAVNQLFEFLKKRHVNVGMRVIEPLITVHLVRNNPKQAFEVVKRIQKEFEYIPARIKLMRALIEAEEVESLQWLTDFSTQHQGVQVTLLSLAVAFLKCQRLRQCRRILESSSLNIKNSLLRNCVNALLVEEDISAVRDLIQVTKGLDSLNRNILYEMLLENYSVFNKWEEGLKLWKQMHEENVTPSELFLVILSELLQRNGQNVPYSLPKTTYDMEKETDGFYAKVTKMYVNSKSYPSRQFLDALVEKLVESGDTETIELIENNWQDLYGHYLKNKSIRFEASVKANKVDSYFQHIKTTLKAGNNTEVSKFIRCIDHKWIKYLLIHPESIESFESLAVQINLEQQYFKPMLLVLSYYFLKDVPKAKKMWNESILNIQQSYSTYSFLVQAYVTAGYFDQLPQLAERIHECPNFNKRMFYEAFLDVFAEQNKYEEGLRVLSKYKPSKQLQEKVEDKEENNDSELIKSQVVL